MKTAEEWLVDIDNAMYFRDTFGREKKWASLEESYMNDPNSNTAIGPNLIYSNGDALMSSLTVPDPEIVVTADSRKGVDTAPIVERLDNKLVGKLSVKKAVDRGLLNAYLFGKLIIKVGYDSLYGYSPYYDIGTREQFFGITMTQFDKMGKRLEFGNQKPGWPWMRAVLPHDFVVPWGTVDIEDAPWCAQRFVRRVDQMKKDPKYTKTSHLEPDMNMEEFMHSYGVVGTQKMRYNSMTSHHENQQPVFKEFWEIRDAEDNRIIVVTRDYDDMIRNDMDAIQIAAGRLPFVCSDFVMHPRSFWTTPLAYYLGQMQETQFDISKQQEKQRRISILKFLVRKGIMTEEQLTRIMSGDVGAYEEVEAGTGLSMNDLVATMPTGQLMDFAMMSEANRRDARDAIGFSRNQMGEYDASSRRTAREATFVYQGAALRTDKRSQMVSDVYVETIDLCNKLIFNFWNTPRDVLVENGWMQVTGGMLKSDYAYDLSLSTKRNLSRAERKIEAFQVLMQLAQFPGVNLGMLYKYLLDAANDPSFERLLPAPGSNQGGRSPSGGLPSIPGSGGSGGGGA